ncbi:sugar ABC transporter permease [Legionella longbeachae]|uniref:ABC transporter permease n=1 Tax=Legionella longbeachae TaxID=450 RepID=UPI0001BEC480|nr:ABC transporter permease [Legionella longbeachae]VEE04026.1 Capsule polysaccharide export inner-membrane protein ctrC [Legionella oakridgensis]ARB93121.1 sugar ABC transporter permease [Legionella longbeachae]ARM33816.1 ABC transporter permease [Legionella longbeachae]EEZ97008.1 ABC-2 type transporter family protein [Legionella longbeachae D-4968]QIN33681.1 ABC transporter permease [Legionella longbeachae]
MQNVHFLTIQKRVISALLLREIIIRYGRNNIGFLWFALEPMMFTLAVTSLWSLMKGMHASNLPITAFALTGYASVLLWRNTSSRCSMAIKANGGLLYHCYVQIIHIFLGRILIEIAGATISFVALSILFISIGWMAPPADILLVILGWFFLAWFGTGLALVIGSISERNEAIERVWHTISYVLFPLSGAAFMVDWLPPAAQKLILYLPMVNGLELLRQGAFGTHVHTHYSISYLIFSCSFILLIGLAMTNEASHHVGTE